MLANESPYEERFHQLLDEVRNEIASLKEELNELEKENSELRTKLQEMEENQADIYSAVSESERLATRQKVLGLISKIDNHLGEVDTS